MDSITVVALALANHQRKDNDWGPIDSLDTIIDKDFYLDMAKVAVNALKDFYSIKNSSVVPVKTVAKKKSNKTNAEKEKEKDKKFVLAWKFPKYKTSKNKLANKMDDVILHTATEVTKSIIKEEWYMAAMYAQDCDDYMTLRKMLIKGAFASAYEFARKMDTGAREIIPDSVREKMRSSVNR